MERKVPKILFIITKSNWGGAQRYVYDLATSLPKDEFEVGVAFGLHGRLAQELEKAGIQTREIRSLQRDISFASDLQSFVELVSLLRREKPDIVHLNSSKVGGLGSLAARVAGVPHIIFTAHGWPFWEKRGRASRAAIWLISWFTALLSHTIITISEHDLRVAKDMPFIRPKAMRIYNGISPIDFLPREDGPAGVRVLTNAELTHNKNHFTGIGAVALAREKGADITYTLMGDGELRQTLEEYVKEKKCEGFVTFLGFVPDGKRHYKNFDIFFLPSKKEGLPYVLLEAGLARLPVLASNTGGIPEIIGNGVSGLLEHSGDTERMAQALVKLARDANLRASLADALYEKVEKDFSLGQMLEKTIAVYRS